MPDSTQQLIEHREQLIRAARIGLGYAMTAAKTHSTAKQHVIEIERALANTVPDANSVLKLLGKKVKRLEEELRDQALEHDDSVELNDN